MTPAMTPIVLWELRDSTVDHTVWCTYSCLGLGAHLVTVHVGGTERFREQHSTAADAYDEAAYLLDHYLLQGWNETAYRDPRVTAPLNDGTRQDADSTSIH
jgi:hypothetical protein